MLQELLEATAALSVMGSDVLSGTTELDCQE